MNTYVKIDSTNKKKALEALRKLAVEMPKVCIMDTGIKEDLGLDMGLGSGPGGIPGAGGGGSLGSIQMVMSYFGGPSAISKERCDTILSTKDHDLGEYDFVYEWTTKPSTAQLEILETDIAKALKPLNVTYKVINK
jgi:hypothetical protein